MPLFFQELPRPAYRKRPRSALLERALIGVAVLSTVAALLFLRPQSTSVPPRITTMRLVPLPPSPVAASASQSVPEAERIRPTAADPMPVGAVSSPPQPQGTFRELQRAAPQDYVGFREIEPGKSPAP
ncbi:MULTISPECIES: hypothetical protein [unclassified Beijerinckia]|uniref:hypothetical protein n=1 Tax=unclassified Beijerinckia TaxID=2638183 RepID=UPI00089AABC0|nr:MULTISPECIES: hypothetical protein [unclassified Beijerinckia]MDH7798582.1 hypothetical protein [Beijerinckia sp. GAS462]SED25671.1 hypothetical protein SAMN05443249_4881 [Beijerinckia sp. 28-YEA-48]